MTCLGRSESQKPRQDRYVTMKTKRRDWRRKEADVGVTPALLDEEVTRAG